MKIGIARKEKITAEIDRVQVKAKVRTIDVSCIDTLVKQLESRLYDLKIAKKNWRGMKFVLDFHAKKFANAYKWTPYSTIVHIERGNSNWNITNICRSPVHQHKITFINQSDFTKFFKF